MNNIFSKSLLRYLSSLRLLVACPILFNGLKSVVTKRVKPTALLCAIDSLSITQFFKNKIFQPFFATKATGEGTGLGLSLSYDIVKAHGEELKVESPPAEGEDLPSNEVVSKFIITLPLNE